MASEIGRLRLRQTLAEAVRRMPDMARGAGGVIALTALLAFALVWVPEGWVHTVLIVGLVVASLMSFGAMTRIGVADDLTAARRLGLGPSGFQMTRVEARLAGATLLCGLFLTIILVMLALIALALSAAAGLDAAAIEARNWGAVGPMWKLVLLTLVGLIVLGTPVVLAIRLCLFAQATVGREQMISLTATGLTNGSMWPLFLGLVTVSLPGLIWATVVMAGVMTGIVATVAAIVVWSIQGPLTSAFLGAAYRRLERPTEGLAPL